MKALVVLLEEVYFTLVCCIALVLLLALAVVLVILSLDFMMNLSAHSGNNVSIEHIQPFLFVFPSISFPNG